MSNCINILNGNVRFHKSVIDIPKLKALIESVKSFKKSPNWEDNAERYFAWWFLAQNTYFEGDYVEIEFGAGRSTHTHRDFRGTLQILKDFMKISKTWTFEITDEYDGHREVSKMKVNFKFYPKFC